MGLCSFCHDVTVAVVLRIVSRDSGKEIAFLIS